MSKYKGYIISDLHIGIKNTKKLYEEYKNIFINNIKNEKKDFIIICGDYFDHKLFLNDEFTSYAYTMMVDLINACDKSTKIRIVYGTESHECNQYDFIDKLSEISKIDIKVIKYASDEELLPNLHILYLPELHFLDKIEYYKDYFKEDKKYDYVFGHGVIREAMKEAATQIENKSSNRKSVPVFSTAELRRICKGQVYFGHYHINTDLDDIYYVGSFTRWQFGEEGRKGFYKVIYDTENNEYHNEFIENTMCDIYKTISFGYQNKVFDSMNNMEKELDKIDKLIKGKLFDHVRFEFNIPESQENPESIMNYINERYKFNDNVKTEIVHGYIENKKKKQKEEIQKKNDKYSFIFDKNMSLEDKTSYFINIEYNRDISPDKISMYLYKPLNEILSE